MGLGDNDEDEESKQDEPILKDVYQIRAFQ